MKIIYLEGFSDDERRAYQEIVNANIFTAVTELLQGVRQEGLQLQPQSEVDHLGFFYFENKEGIFIIVVNFRQSQGKLGSLTLTKR